MPSNIEIKAKLYNYSETIAIAKRLNNSPYGTILHQEDTFFKSENGRLKLRVKSERPESSEEPWTESAELIFYQRNNQTGPKSSLFFTTPIQDHVSFSHVLGESNGVIGTVKKTRRLYLTGQTRIHIDKVDGLGDFIELEVVMKEGQANEEGEAIAHDLMKTLNIKDTDLMDCAYMDLILQQQTSTSN